MSEIGKYLKEVREKKNLTLAQISEKLRVKEEYLRNIEDNNDLPRDVFTLGYIRLYAKHLRVDIEKRITAFKNGEEESLDQDEKVIDGDVTSEENTSLKDQLIHVVQNPKYIKIAAAAFTTVVVVVVLFVIFNRNSIESSDMSSADSAVDLTSADSSSSQKVDANKEDSAEDMTITKISNDEYLIQNISSNANKAFVVANDSTMITFFR